MLVMVAHRKALTMVAHRKGADQLPRPMSGKISVPHTSEVGIEAVLGPLQHLLGPLQGVPQSLSTEQESSLQLGTGPVSFSCQPQTERCELVSTRSFFQSHTESPFAIEKQ